MNRAAERLPATSVIKSNVPVPNLADASSSFECEKSLIRVRVMCCRARTGNVRTTTAGNDDWQRSLSQVVDRQFATKVTSIISRIGSAPGQKHTTVQRALCCAPASERLIVNRKHPAWQRRECIKYLNAVAGDSGDDSDVDVDG